METNKTLLEQGFSQDEIDDMAEMTEAILLYFGEKNATINWKVLAIMHADTLVQMGKTQKVREFAARIHEKLKSFS